MEKYIILSLVIIISQTIKSSIIEDKILSIKSIILLGFINICYFIFIKNILNNINDTTYVFLPSIIIDIIILGKKVIKKDNNFK